MPLVYQQNINASTRIGVWHIAEPENFFLSKVPLQREITHPHKRLQHLAGRLLLQELYPGFPQELIKIADTNKPFLENEAYHFSISHCGDYAAVIVSTEFRVGADIELINDKVERIIHKFLQVDEMRLINLKSEPDSISKAQLLTLAWSIKESLFKWYGKREVDFKKHLRIDDINIDDNQGVAHCRFLKNMSMELPVHFLFFNQNCLSWVSSK